MHKTAALGGGRIPRLPTRALTLAPVQSVIALREEKPELILDLYTLLGRIMARGKNRATERLSNLTDAVNTNNTRSTLMNRRTKRRLEKLGFA